MREVRSDRRPVHLSPHDMARRADRGREDLLPAPRYARGRRRRRRLRREPRIELPARLRDDPHAHPGVFDAAELGTCAGEHTRAGGEQAEHVRLPGDDVHLRAELGHPQIVNDVGGRQLEFDRHAGRDMRLVRGNGAVRVAELEPPLVADDADLERRLEAAERRPTADLRQRDEAQAEDDSEHHERRGGPRDLESPVAVDLRGEPARARTRIAVADGEHDEGAENAGKDECRDGADDQREHDDRLEGAPHARSRYAGWRGAQNGGGPVAAPVRSSTDAPVRPPCAPCAGRGSRSAGPRGRGAGSSRRRGARSRGPRSPAA